jgi:hypothetical protein
METITSTQQINMLIAVVMNIQIAVVEEKNKPQKKSKENRYSNNKGALFTRIINKNWVKANSGR